jgi:hypothetical protein
MCVRVWFSGSVGSLVELVDALDAVFEPYGNVHVWLLFETTNNGTDGFGCAMRRVG